MESKSIEIYSSITLKSSQIYFGIFAIFIFNPLIGIVLSALYGIKTRNYGYIKLLIIITTLYLSAINTNKTPESDLRQYINMFLRVPFDGFWSTLTYLSYSGNPKDIVYSSSVYFLYYLLFGNPQLFIFVVSFLSFYFAFKSIYRFGMQSKLPFYIIVAQILTLAFFTQYFSLSAHLIRQQLAISIFFYALSFRAESIKKYIILCSVAFLIHSSVIVIAIIGVFPFMSKQLHKKELLMLVFFAVFFMVAVSALGSFILASVNLSGESLTAASRMANIEGAQDTTDGVGGIMNVISILFTIITLYEILKRKRYNYPIINLCFVWSILILSLAAAPLIQYRFFYIEYNFLPFLLFLPLQAYKSLLKLQAITIVISMVFLFYYSLNNVFKYLPADEAICLPFPFLINLV